jgi:hypothetical protein
MWQGEYHMEVGHRQEFGFSLFKPVLPGNLLAFGAVSVPTGMIHDTLSTAVVAALHVASQLRGSAVKQVG